MLAVALYAGLRIARPGVLPGVTVAGVAVGGLESDQLRAALQRLEDRRGEQTVTLTRGDATVTVRNAQAGYDLGVDATAALALEHGRQANPLDALADHWRAFNATIDVGAVESVDSDELAAFVDEAARRLRRAPVEGSVRFEGAEVVPVSPTAGARVLTEPLSSDLQAALLTPGAETLTVSTEPVVAETTERDMQALVDQAERAVSAPVRLVRNDSAIVFEPAEIGELLRPQRRATGDQVRLGFRVDPQALAAQLDDDAIAGVEAEPVDAQIALDGGEIVITPASEGFQFSPQAAADQLERIVTKAADASGVRQAQLAGQTVPADRTTAEARELGITEQVSTFTTNHACCESRVTNIHRFADLVDGAVIEPGERFSLNGHVGERTVEKGFVGGGAIFDGEFVEQVGGGVSQFATTFFNATWFGGYEILDYKAHSYYISRYPVGRESTINFPNVDVVILNDSPHGILVDTSYTDTSITVSFYGTEWVDVETITGEPHNYEYPETVYQENNELPVGSSQVVQSAGGPGFDIVVTRVLRFPDGRSEREEYFTRYLPEDQIVERNTA